MRNFQRYFVFVLLIFGFTATSFAQQIQLSQNRPGGIYKTGEQVIFTANLEGAETDSITVKVRKKLQ